MRIAAGVVLMGTAWLRAARAGSWRPVSFTTALSGLLNAPPTRTHLVGADGRSAPLICPLTLNRSARAALRGGSLESQWLSPGFARGGSAVVRRRARSRFFFGADGFGRDVFTRLLFGARTSLGLSFGGASGLLGGVMPRAAWPDTWRSVATLSDARVRFRAGPARHVRHTGARSVMPLVLSAPTVFLIPCDDFCRLGAPHRARRESNCPERICNSIMRSAPSLGAGHSGCSRVICTISAKFSLLRLTLLVPGFIIAEATLSYVGLGFPDPVTSWGTMLHDASNLRAFADFPWLLVRPPRCFSSSSG